MGLIRGLPSHLEAVVAQVAHEQGCDATAVLNEAVLDLQDRMRNPIAPNSLTIPLGADLDALAVPTGLGAARLRIAAGNLHVDLTCAGPEPNADEVAAIERLTEAAIEVRDLAWAAYRRTRREVSDVTSMDPGPAGPSPAVPDDQRPTPTPDEPSGEPE